MAKMTQAQHKKRATLDRKLTAAISAVYDAATPRQDVVFSECLALATPEVRAAYITARENLDTFQDELVNEGRAYRASFGMFIANTR